MRSPPLNEDVSMNLTSRTALVATLVACHFTATGIESVEAQKGDEVVRGLLRALIESQLEKSNRREVAPPPARLGPGRNNTPPDRLSPRVNQLRPIASSFAQEATTLRALLQTDAARDFHVRNHLGDAMRLQATASAVQQRTAMARTDDSVRNSFQSLNTAWTSLAHELSTCNGLRNQTTACIGRLNRLDQQYCAILGIQTGFDRQQVIQTSYALSAYCRDLLESLQVGSRPSGRNRILQRKLGHLCEEVDYFAGLVSDNVQFQTAVVEYTQLYGEWKQLEGQLNQQASPTVTRGIRRIREAHRTLHNLLRMTMTVDPEYVHELVHELEERQRLLFQTITLEQLMVLPDSELVSLTANELAGSIENMDQLIVRKRGIAELAEAFGFIDNAWNRLAFYLEPIREPQTLATLAATHDAVKTIQVALGVTIEFDRTALLNMASSLEQLSDTLERTLIQWQRRPGTHDRSLVSKAHQMSALFHEIEQALAVNRSVINTGQCDQAIQLWQEIRPTLKTCTTIEQEQFQHIVNTMTPELIRFRTLLSQ